MNFIAHASGSSGNLYTLEDGEHRLAIELGLPFRRIRQALQFKTSELSGALISHGHGDHAAGVRDALKAGVDCYLSAGTAEEIGVAGHHRAHIIKAKEGFRLGTFRVFPFEAVHDALEPLNFVVSGSLGGRLLYVTDTAYCPYRFTGLTVVAIEANYTLEALRRGVESGAYPLAHKNRVLSTHMSLDRALQLLRANDLSRVEAIHLLHLSDGNSDELRFLEAVRRATGIPTYVAAERSTA